MLAAGNTDAGGAPIKLESAFRALPNICVGDPVGGYPDLASSSVLTFHVPGSPDSKDCPHGACRCLLCNVVLKLKPNYGLDPVRQHANTNGHIQQLFVSLFWMSMALGFHARVVEMLRGVLR